VIGFTLKVSPDHVPQKLEERNSVVTEIIKTLSLIKLLDIIIQVSIV
jgi:hypothetical protein